MGKFLTESQRDELRRQHKYENERRYADRIKALLLWDSGWKMEQISEALLLDESTIRRYRRTYEEEGIDELLNDDFVGSQSRLSSEQEQQLLEHLLDHVYQSTAEICDYAHQSFGFRYSNRGMCHVLKRLGFVYKKTKAIPGKADSEKQELFVEEYEELKKSKRPEDPVYFIDGVHPQHNSKPAHGWILKGEEKQIPTKQAC